MVTLANERSAVLIVEAEEVTRSLLTQMLQAQGYGVESCSSLSNALQLLEKSSFPIVLCDPEAGDEAGFDCLKKIKERDHEIQVIILSKSARVDLAVSSIQHGAFDLLVKPIGSEQLILTLARLEEHLRVVKENKQLKEEVDHTFSFAGIVSHNEEMKQVFETVKRLSAFTSTVLITGESGTGKELIARAIHNNSLRKNSAFVAINCGAIPENLIESELFGHRKGAFTDAVKDKRGLLEEASSGTLFLDEIGEMPAVLQVKLLRALQERSIRPLGDEKTISIDTRVIAATNRDLDADVKSGVFREDLFYRLNVVAIHLPALRDRKEDIPVLCQHFITKVSRRLSLSPRRLSAAVLAKLTDYGWPGNIRELENCLERALLLSSGDSIEIKDLPEHLRTFEPQVVALGAFSNDSLSIKLHAEQLEIRLIKEALIRTGGNRTHAARLLEISHRALLYKLKDYHLVEFLKD
jgi:two-component system response regulator AtoC